MSNEEEEEEISGSDCVSVGSFDSDTLLESNILSQKFYDQLHDTTNTELVIPKWERNCTFDGVDAESKFDEWRNFRETRNGDNASPLGLKCSINSVNSVNKSWRQIFTNNILDMIVKYTNEYGDAKGDDKFEAITRDELLDFICILFIASIQKRKDRPRQWFSNEPLLESRIIKKIMSGNKFHNVLRHFHVCCLEKQPARNSIEYNSIYKVQELMDVLEARYVKLFNPGQKLRLDEPLIRAFGRIKFKVRIITKSARYGIKLYVVTDANTAFVLKVIVYTGAGTYAFDTSVDVKKP